MSTEAGRKRVEDWIEAYEEAWRTPGTARLDELFTETATYRFFPYDPPFEGLAAIKEMWEAERQGPDETFTMASSVVALDNDTAVARVEVVYGDPPTEEFRDLWIIRLADDGRCESFEEWPFWPDRGRSPSDSA